MKKVTKKTLDQRLAIIWGITTVISKKWQKGKVNLYLQLHLVLQVGLKLHTPYIHTGTSKKKMNMVKKLIFSCNAFQNVKLSYILDSLHVK